MTVFLGCGFAAKYREGGGVFSVPLQWVLGLRRLKLDVIWLELFPSSGDRKADASAIRSFQRQLRAHGLSRNYCLLYQARAADSHELEEMRCYGLTRRHLRDRLAGPNTLLNLSYSIHPPLLFEFERRIFCDLDPSEIFYWMTKMEMGQSHHHQFWTIGLNQGAADCQLPKPVVSWKTFFPLVDTEFIKPRPRAGAKKLTTIGQWYWGGAVEVDGKFPDLSKKHAFERYLDLPSRVNSVRFELAMNIAGDDPERERLAAFGWRVVDPHRVARTASQYRRYIASADGEFTAVKGVDVSWRTGWLSDRAASFLAMGRPVITEDTGAGPYLPRVNGFRFVKDAEAAAAATREVCADWPALGRTARDTAVELFDSTKNLQRILQI